MTNREFDDSMIEFVNKLIRESIEQRSCTPIAELISAAKGEECTQILDYLFWAGLERNLSTLVQFCLDSGYNIESDDPGDFGAFYIAMSRFGDRSDIAERLVSLGCDVERRSHNNWTPLQAAAAGKFNRVARVLIANGADVNARTIIDENSTALMIAAQQGDEPLVKLLLDSGADVTAKNIWGKDAAHLASAGGFDDVRALIETWQVRGEPRRRR